MVLGRRRFTLQDDVRGVLTVVAMGLLSLAALTAVLGLILLLVTPETRGTP